MGNEGRRVVEHSGIYLLGSLLARAVSFVMLPIYTRKLTPADYGTIELLTMVIDLTGVLVSMRVGQGIFRYYFDCKNEREKKEVLFSGYATALLTSLCGLVFVQLFSEELSVMIFGSSSVAKLIRLFSITLVFQSLIETPMVMLRAQQRPWLFISLNVVKLLLMLSLNIYFIVLREMHVEGVVYSSLLSGGIMSLILGIHLLRHTGISFSFDMVKRMAKFSLPLMAVGGLSFYINFGDRYFLRVLGGGLEEVGLYSLGYKFGFLLFFVVGDPFFSVWDSEKYRIYNEVEEPGRLYRKVFLLYSCLLSLAVLGMSLFGKTVIVMMANEEYWMASRIIPVISAAYAVNCLAGYASLGLYIHKRTVEVTYGTIVAGVVVTLGYLVLIPRFGAMGAAYATLLAFLSRLAWVTVRSSKYYDMKLQWERVSMMFVTVVIIWQLVARAGEFPVPVSLAINSFALALGAAAIIALPILPRQVRSEVLCVMSSPVANIGAVMNSRRRRGV